MPNLLEPLRVKEFRRFWFGGAISVFGDHLTFIAMPWLVLKLTGDPLAMGTVIAIAAVMVVIQVAAVSVSPSGSVAAVVIAAVVIAAVIESPYGRQDQLQ